MKMSTKKQAENAFGKQKENHESPSSKNTIDLNKSLSEGLTNLQDVVIKDTFEAEADTTDSQKEYLDKEKYAQQKRAKSPTKVQKGNRGKISAKTRAKLQGDRMDLKSQEKTSQLNLLENGDGAKEDIQ